MKGDCGQYSEYVYDNVIEECVHGQEGRIDRLIKSGQEYLEANTKEWMVTGKEFVVRSLRDSVLPMVMSFIWSSKPKEEGEKKENVKEDLNTSSVHD